MRTSFIHRHPEPEGRRIFHWKILRSAQDDVAYKGFTLIEIVVALAIVAIGVVALLTAHRTALVHRQRAWAERVAVRWAGEKLDEIASLGALPATGGRETVSGLALNWSGKKRVLEKGLAEWSVEVGWGQKQKEKMRLVTWRREKIDEGK